MPNKIRIYTKYINQCSECPNFDYYSTSCLIGGKYKAITNGLDTPPDWCPLPIKTFKRKEESLDGKGNGKNRKGETKMMVFWIGMFWILMSLGFSTGLARLMIHLFSGGF